MPASRVQLVKKFLLFYCCRLVISKGERITGKEFSKFPLFSWKVSKAFNVRSGLACQGAFQHSWTKSLPWEESTIAILQYFRWLSIQIKPTFNFRNAPKNNELWRTTLQSFGRGKITVFVATRDQPRSLVPMGRGCFRGRERKQQADISFSRILHMSLVSRDGKRIVWKPRGNLDML